MKKIILLLTIFILTISCGNSEKSKDGSSGSIYKSEIESPCEILSEIEIKEVLGIPPEAETKMEEKDRLYSMCKYKWESVPYNSEVRVGDIRKSVDNPAEMYVTMVKDVTAEQFNKAVATYDDGVSQQGIGEMASWSGKKRQVSFFKDGTLVHVYLRTSADEEENKKNVLAMAKSMSEKF